MAKAGRDSAHPFQIMHCSTTRVSMGADVISHAETRRPGAEIMHYLQTAAINGDCGFPSWAVVIPSHLAALVGLVVPEAAMVGVGVGGRVVVDA